MQISAFSSTIGRVWWVLSTIGEDIRVSLRQHHIVNVDASLAFNVVYRPIAPDRQALQRIGEKIGNGPDDGEGYHCPKGNGEDGAPEDAKF